MSLIHELPGLIQEHGLEVVRRTHCPARRSVVFPADVVRDSFYRVERTCLRTARLVQPAGAVCAERVLWPPRMRQGASCGNHSGFSAATRIVLAVGYADHRKGIDLFVDVGVRVAERAGRRRVRVGRPPRAVGIRARHGKRGAGRPERPVRVSRPDQGQRPVFRGRRRVSDDVARGSVSESWFCRRWTPSFRSSDSREPAGSSSCCERGCGRSGAACRHSRRWPTPCCSS